ncbi:CLUMA_CG006689, isoform A [Clunio marinus]|uniref:CLUMA_CG006689, isoform A n=1 Tax=Clunio marinus TaxID=568069 RepID=A0A1J1HZR9_9DIPT|nr:CLUMA_CG006689, isoform A [Clunio marinus]
MVIYSRSEKENGKFGMKFIIEYLQTRNISPSSSSTEYNKKYKNVFEIRYFAYLNNITENENLNEKLYFQKSQFRFIGYADLSFHDVN